MSTFLPQYGDPQPVVRMGPTILRTYGLSVLGTNATPIVPRAPGFRRVLIVQTAGAGAAFVSAASSELSNAGAVTPGEAFQLPASPTPLVFVLSPDQALFAAGAVANTSVSVSVSEEIPVTPLVRNLHETVFRTYTLPTLTNPAVRVVPESPVPRRVLVDPRGGGGGATAFLAASAAELSSPGAVTPGEAFQMPLNIGPVAIILAPRQALYAASNVGTQSLMVAVSDLQTGALRSPTGYPGADGLE